MDKQINKWIALNLANDEDFSKFPKKAASFRQEKQFLNAKYGVYTVPKLR